MRLWDMHICVSGLFKIDNVNDLWSCVWWACAAAGMQGQQQADARQQHRVSSRLAFAFCCVFARVSVSSPHFAKCAGNVCLIPHPPPPVCVIALGDGDRTRQGGVWALQMNSVSPTSGARYSYISKYAILYQRFLSFQMRLAL